MYSSTFKKIAGAAMMAAVLFAGTAAAQSKQSAAVYMAGEEPTGAAGVHKVFGGELAKAISRSDKYSAVDRTDAIQNQLAKEHNFQRSGAVSNEQIKALGSQFGVGYLCIVDISALQGGSYYIDVRLVDVVTAEIMNSATASGNLKNSDEIMRVAQRIAREIADAEGVAQEMKRSKTRKKIVFTTGITLDVLGIGMLAYGLYEDYAASGFIDDGKFSYAKKSIGYRDAAYIAGAALIFSGISIHIFF